MMSQHFDNLETLPASEREAALFASLPDFLTEATQAAPGLAEWLTGVDLRQISSRDALTKLPVLRKPELMGFQAANPPFGGFANPATLKHSRVFLSPGP